MNLKFIISNIGPTSGTHLDLPELLSGQAKGEFVAPPLVLEAIDASKGLCNGHVEDEMGHGEKCDGDPTMAALEVG